MSSPLAILIAFGAGFVSACCAMALGVVLGGRP